RALLDRAVRRLHLLCATLLHRGYPRLAQPPLNVQADELLGAIAERLLKARRRTVRRLFAYVEGLPHLVACVVGALGLDRPEQVERGPLLPSTDMAPKLINYRPELGRPASTEITRGSLPSASTVCRTPLRTTMSPS